MEYRFFQIDRKDNVATALMDIPKGAEAELVGDADLRGIETREPVPMGHKIALEDIPAQGSIVKYGVVIGSASINIKKGSWVHLHVMHSNYDERSDHLDPVTGAPKDTKYE